MAKKYYVVWQGRAPGIYQSWELCQQQVKGYSAAQFKAFPTLLAAQEAFAERPSLSSELSQNNSLAAEVAGNKRLKPSANLAKSAKSATGMNGKSSISSLASSNIITPSIAVDASCLGNPGAMEYRGVDTATHSEIFHQGPFVLGTNNIGEFLAIVHALAYCTKNDDKRPIYSDSINAITWVRNKKCRTKLVRSNKNEDVFALIARAEKWLQNNPLNNQILKWHTSSWGEIPADFGRK